MLSCINFTISLLRGSLSNIKTFLPAEILSATVVRLESPDATQFFTNRLSMGPSTIRTGSCTLILSIPNTNLSSLSVVRIVIYLRVLSLVSNARPDTAIKLLYTS